MKTLLYIVLIALPLIGTSQTWKSNRSEIVAGLGGTSLLSDVGGGDDIGSTGISSIKDINLSKLNNLFHLGYRYKLTETFALKGNFFYGRLAAADDQAGGNSGRQQRNITVRTPIFEVGGQLEFYPFKDRSGHLYRIRNVKGKSPNLFSPYVFIGIGGIYFDPKGFNQEGEWISLNELQTENTEYSKISGAAFLGGGLKLNLSKTFSIGVEIGARNSFTDYLDDTSGNYRTDIATLTNADQQYLSDPSENFVSSRTGEKRGNPDNNDSYIFGTINIGIKFGGSVYTRPKL